MEKYRTAGRLIILSLVTSLQERQRHWQFALQFLFALLRGKQPRPLFRTQVPLHEQETSTDPWSYLTSMESIEKKLMNEWKRGGVQHFHLLQNARKDFRVFEQPIHKRLLPRNLPNQWIHLIPYQIWFHTESIPKTNDVNGLRWDLIKKVKTTRPIETPLNINIIIQKHMKRSFISRSHQQVRPQLPKEPSTSSYTCAWREVRVLTECLV